jgi:hypothetical protein
MVLHAFQTRMNVQTQHWFNVHLSRDVSIHQDHTNVDVMLVTSGMVLSVKVR